VTITNFNVSLDELDFLSFPQFLSFNDIAFTTNPLTLYPENYFQIILTTVNSPQSFSTTNFLFNPSSSSSSGSSSSSSSTINHIGKDTVGFAAILIPVVILLFCLLCIWGGVIDRNKKEKDLYFEKEEQNPAPQKRQQSNASVTKRKASSRIEPLESGSNRSNNNNDNDNDNDSQEDIEFSDDDDEDQFGMENKPVSSINIPQHFSLQGESVVSSPTVNGNPVTASLPPPCIVAVRHRPTSNPSSHSSSSGSSRSSTAGSFLSGAFTIPSAASSSLGSQWLSIFGDDGDDDNDEEETGNSHESSVKAGETTSNHEQDIREQQLIRTTNIHCHSSLSPDIDLEMGLPINKDVRNNELPHLHKEQQDDDIDSLSHENFQQLLDQLENEEDEERN
jgi:hypothetical protein